MNATDGIMTKLTHRMSNNVKMYVPVMQAPQKMTIIPA
jgi:hypothetical protein